MKTVAASLMCACMALAAGGVAAQDAMKKAPMKDDMMSKPMTMQECKDHMAMAKKDGKKDAAMMKKDAMCKDMMDKDKMKKP
ncbi:MAG: hypothetical protein M3496_07965 [Pseudomonadota bacterium]|nr:hypothetical protein [Burkholderiaceae bacterium]MDQ3446097.1 hypothetical protein [Pseudomonadota bacterium]